jgi:hypothetical protein
VPELFHHLPRRSGQGPGGRRARALLGVRGRLPRFGDTGRRRTAGSERPDPDRAAASTSTGAQSANSSDAGSHAAGRGADCTAGGDAGNASAGAGIVTRSAGDPGREAAAAAA